VPKREKIQGNIYHTEIELLKSESIMPYDQIDTIHYFMRYFWEEFIIPEW